MMTTTKTNQVRDGIEWYTVTLAGGREENECQCARCGSSAEPVSCWNCRGDGVVEHFGWDIHEDKTYLVACDWCRGVPTTWHCVSSPEWCRANPLPGREHIESTALRAEAWSD